MQESLSYILSLCPALLTLTSLLPSFLLFYRASTVRRFVTFLAGTQFLVALVGLLAYGTGAIGTVHTDLIRLPSYPLIALSLHYDGVSSVMFTLVSFIGWVICSYSIRYLDGEAAQQRYFRWVALTLGSVSWMVISGNLLMFVTAWVATSLGLHQLLVHYRDRPAAIRAAWSKFIVSRLGDLALLLALILIYREFGTFEFSQLFEQASEIKEGTLWVQAAGFLLVAGAITKSAQFPFHTWLPQTMETPTPVSAFMHAGIVNAGGYMIVRTSPIVALAPSALTMLALVGGFTACFGAVVMLTQTSVKKSLAYSTIAQMGFMMLQCGIGAYSAAMLHLVAHSLYKAYAFLSSGRVIADASLTRRPSIQSKGRIGQYVIIASLTVIFLWLTFSMFNIDVLTKAGGPLLAGVLCLALTQWLVRSMQYNHSLRVVAVLTAAVLTCLYVASYSAMDRLIGASLPKVIEPSNSLLITMVVLAAFSAMLFLQLILSNRPTRAKLNSFYVHASNGFYCESVVRRVLKY